MGRKYVASPFLGTLGRTALGKSTSAGFVLPCRMPLPVSTWPFGHIEYGHIIRLGIWMAYGIWHMALWLWLCHDGSITTGHQNISYVKCHMSYVISLVVSHTAIRHTP